MRNPGPPSAIAGVGGATATGPNIVEAQTAEATSALRSAGFATYSEQSPRTDAVTSPKTTVTFYYMGNANGCSGV